MESLVISFLIWSQIPGLLSSFSTVFSLELPKKPLGEREAELN